MSEREEEFLCHGDRRGTMDELFVVTETVAEQKATATRTLDMELVCHAGSRESKACSFGRKLKSVIRLSEPDHRGRLGRNFFRQNFRVKI